MAKLPEGTIVQHWSDAAPARAGAAQGLPLIMSPAPHAYLDQKYDDVDRARPDVGRRRRGARLPTSGTRPRSSPRRDVLGVEAALWTETTETRDDVDSLVFPRLAAVAEVGWSERPRLGGLPVTARPPTAPLLRELGVNFHPSKQWTGARAVAGPGAGRAADARSAPAVR